MKIARLKNSVLLLLVIIAMVQSIRLWFGDHSSRNLFYSIIGEKNTYHATELSIMPIAPTRLILNHGNRNFSVCYGEDDTQELYQSAYDCVRQMLQQGEFVESKPLDSEEMLSGRSVILDYFFPVTSTDYTRSFRDNRSALSSKALTFNKVVITPSRSQSESLRITFVNEYDMMAHVFLAGRGKAGEVLDIKIEEAADNSDLFYIASNMSGLNLFESNFFIPQWSDELTYRALEIVDPFYEDTDMYAYIDSFFTNPAAKWQTHTGGVPIYSDESTVVKFHPNGLLEYSYYIAGQQSANDRMEVAYSAAVHFLQRDATINNELYLANAVAADGGWDFYFEYIFDNFPVLFSEEVLNDLGMTHGIELSVRDGRVSKYKRLVKQFREKRVKPFALTVDFTTALEYFVDKEHNEAAFLPSEVQEVMLAYYIDGKMENPINWFVQVNDRWLLMDTKEAP